MIDPQDITDFNRSTAELEELILFCVAVAGKTARIIAHSLEKFLNTDHSDRSPFEKIQEMIRVHSLLTNLQFAKLGKYDTLVPCFRQLATDDIDLRTCTVDELETYPGIGPKTSRFFILHSRPNQKFACLDTHILSYLRDLGHEAPKVTPTGKRYAKLEQIFIEHAEELDKDLADFDLEIWNKYSKRSGLSSGRFTSE